MRPRLSFRVAGRRTGFFLANLRGLSPLVLGRLDAGFAGAFASRPVGHCHPFNGNRMPSATSTHQGLASRIAVCEQVSRGGNRKALARHARARRQVSKSEARRVTRFVRFPPQLQSTGLGSNDAESDLWDFWLAID